MSLTLEERLIQIQDRMAQAALRADRDPATVKLLPASKKVSVEVLRELINLGIRQLGENKVQEAKLKVSMIPASCSWHFIGGLQRNKVKDAVRIFQTIHSLDRIEVIDEVAQRATEAGKIIQVLVEVNTAGEASKHGARPDEVLGLVQHANAQKSLEIVGLMAVVPFLAEVENVRPYFKSVRELRDQVQNETGIILPELSMGMSHDFEVAIEEGATWVRVGTALFGQRS